MKTMSTRTRASGALILGIAASVVVLSAGIAQAQYRIEGVTGMTTLDFTAKAGEVSTPEGGSLHFWGYQEDSNSQNIPGGAALPQYPGPTLIVNQGAAVTINFKSELPFEQCSSIIFPGHDVSATGGSVGLLTNESCATIDAETGDVVPGETVAYSFTASEPGTYTYYSGTESELQIEMGLVGALIVRPSMGEDHAYNHADTRFDNEYLFLLTSMDPSYHALAEQGRFDEIDMTTRWPVYWFINGSAAPDDLANSFVPWLPHQPYNIIPRMTPGQRVLVRIIGGDQDQHPLHLHGNHYNEIARYGRMLASGPSSGPDLKRGKFTTLSVPGQTVDAIFEWTGEKLGWDIYGGADVWPEMAHGCDALVNPDAPYEPGVNELSNADVVYDSVTHEYCLDHGKEFPVVLPETQNLAFGGWWSGSPYMGGAGALPPGEGGLNPFGGYFFMWHSHTEKELTNFDIFPGGMLSMMVVEPPGTVIDNN